MFKPLTDYISRLLNASDKTADVVLLAYAATVVCDLVWLTHAVYKGHGFEQGWNDNFLTLSGLITITKVNGAWANRTGGGDAPPKEQGRAA